MPAEPGKPGENDVVAEPRIIKKYPNRRLYDTEESRYITLADVQQLLRKGLDLKVVDSQSGDDITRSILIQIITDQESGDEPVFTTDMLRRFIRFYDEAAHDVFSSYLDQSLQLFSEQHKFIQEQVQDVFSGRTVMDSMAEMTRRNFEIWQDLQKTFFTTAGLSSKDKDSDSEP
jgi:polyhydroxyalkanoate synthesis repressor PhaR